MTNEELKAAKEFIKDVFGTVPQSADDIDLPDPTADTINRKLVQDTGADIEKAA